MVLAVGYLLQPWLRRKTKHGRLPPGPRGVPILGHLHLLGKNPHHDLNQLAKKYGPIMYMHFGFVPIIVVSSPEAAEQFLKTHDVVFASRPPLQAAKYISYEQNNMTFVPYGHFWRTMRKLCTSELLSHPKISSFQSMRKEELCLLVDFIEQASRDNVAVDLSAKIASMSADMSCRMVFGKKYEEEKFDERGFKAVMRDVMQLSAAPHLGDFFPYIGALDLQGLTRRMKALSKVFDDFYEKIIDEHIQFRDRGQTKDFVDIVLDFMESEQAEHPRVMRKVQDELENVVGLDRMVEESDTKDLHYLEMVVKEAFRLHPIAPLLLPHEATEDCNINGYYIPKKARIAVNVWAIGRDPNVWTDADKFIPERFARSSIDRLPTPSIWGWPERVRRMQLGLTMVRLVVAQLVHCFDWELPNMLLEELDMSEAFGMVTSRDKHLLAIPTLRLHK
ncbi:unnamed protein product [Thlaspi arvense]|uniref:Cytochrome P450 n=1 Tax=Thlaspi arvense TaxID=13288 RepID=A0AAU9RGY4_THLAR|nr:unnamed protein product [Thlaspi arvense]